MTKCSICGAIAEYELTPYTGATPGTMSNYCKAHALGTMESDAVKTYKVVKKDHVYRDLKYKLGETGGGYVK